MDMTNKFYFPDDVKIDGLDISLYPKTAGLAVPDTGGGWIRLPSGADLSLSLVIDYRGPDCSEGWWLKISTAIPLPDAVKNNLSLSEFYTFAVSSVKGNYTRAITISAAEIVGTMMYVPDYDYAYAHFDLTGFSMPATDIDDWMFTVTPL